MKLRVKTPPVGDPDNQDQFQKFGNWTNSTNTKVMAQDLMKRGLVGANQIVDDASNPNTSSADAVRNNQSDWKVAAVQNILANARRFNIRKPEEVNANKDALMSTLNPQYKDAINSQTFQQIHPNFWDVISKSILPEQYAKEDATNNTAKN